MMACGRYIERNPVSAGLCKHAREWSWSSAGFYANGGCDPLTNRYHREFRTTEEYSGWLEEQLSVEEKLFRIAKGVISWTEF
ncbi:MAG: hypothetical protein JSV84_03500 [Gemmatimonadota bacterium]|nr:MAG: hypothetical protein JSV84_03500 [Gemmatimonadota bacterium]